MSQLVGQVGGHADTMSVDASGSLLFKTTSAREIEFYNQLGPLKANDFVGYWTPKFYGTLSMEQVGSTAIVLENLTQHFERANIADFKLGTQFWDEDSSQDKMQRMEAASKATTSGTTGLRLTGCRSWNSKTEGYEKTGKEYGKAITPDELPRAIEKAFPFSPPGDTESGHLPANLMLSVLQQVEARLQQYLQDVAPIEWRLRGSSLLIMYEGDAASLQQAIDGAGWGHNTKYDTMDSDEGDQTCSSCPSPGPVHDSNSDDGTDANTKPNPDVVATEDITDNKEDTDSASDEESHAGEPFRPGVLVKAIDFAHAWDYTGQGPDDGYVKGIRSLLYYIQQHIQRITSTLKP